MQRRLPDLPPDGGDRHGADRAQPARAARLVARAGSSAAAWLLWAVRLRGARAAARQPARLALRRGRAASRGSSTGCCARRTALSPVVDARAWCSPRWSCSRSSTCCSSRSSSSCSTRRSSTARTSGAATSTLARGPEHAEGTTRMSLDLQHRSGSCSWACCFTGYAILDGFDLGVGALHLFVEDGRATAASSSTPSARSGTATRSGWSPAAARSSPPSRRSTPPSSPASTSRSCCCSVALIFRAVAIEFRSKQPIAALARASGTSASPAAASAAGAAHRRGHGQHRLGRAARRRRRVRRHASSALLHPYALLIGRDHGRALRHARRDLPRAEDRGRAAGRGCAAGSTRHHLLHPLLRD